ncbi:MAG: rhodanese-like domain-containing protein [Nitrospirales bacterium]|nr:rhodanese-like domain-containing protein [Nitrospira sp.]MDR4503116.1 rhodanese-like domain-containing protein [Nitrospirales bacterium]
MQIKHLMRSLTIIFLLFGLSHVSMAAKHYDLSVQQLKAGLDKAQHPSQKGFILVDVRTPEEHQEGFIPGTDFNIDYRELPQRYRDLGADFDDHIVVYCQSGHRSNIAADTLTKIGYKHVYNVEGSMNAWQAAGFEVDHPR